MMKALQHSRQKRPLAILAITNGRCTVQPLQKDRSDTKYEF